MSSWYKRFNKISQISELTTPVTDVQSSLRYRGTMVYEVRIPSSGDSRQDEQTASQAAGDLYQRVFEAVGDEVVTFDSPEYYGKVAQ